MTCNTLTKKKKEIAFRHSHAQTKLGKEKAQQMDWNKLLGTRSNDTVVDFGAGGGHILAVLNVSRRIAVEISDVARDAMEKVYPGLIEGYRFPEDLPDDSVDLMFSTSAIEHFECPLTELREMARKVKVGGRVVSSYCSVLFPLSLSW